MERDLLYLILAMETGEVSGALLTRHLVEHFLASREGTLMDKLRESGVVSEALHERIHGQLCSVINANMTSVPRALAAKGGAHYLANLLAGQVDQSAWERTLVAAAELAGEEDVGAITDEAEGRYVTGKLTGSGGAEIGRGGIGRVLVTFDNHLGREIAIKELLDESTRLLPGSDWSVNSTGLGNLARFLREARVTGQLEHPNIVPVYELGRRADGRVYYTMKLVRGRTLQAAISEAPSFNQRLRLLPHYVDVCQALAYAHSRGVVHRDIKPQNVMVGEFGETVVLDWGLARMKGTGELHRNGAVKGFVTALDDTTRTLDGCAVGTPSYMSPEQARGELRLVDERSDVWSLGILLYEILVGKPPFGSGSVTEILTRVEEQKIVPPDEVDDEIFPDLAAVCMKALRREPSQRYQSAQELSDEIQAFQAGRRLQAYRYSSWELLKRLVMANKALTALAVCLVLVLTVGIVVSYNSFRREEAARVAESRQRELAEEEKREAEHQKEVADRARHEAEAQRKQAAHSHLRSEWNLSVALHEESDRRLNQRDYLISELYAAAALNRIPGVDVLTEAEVLQRDVRMAALHTNVYLSRVSSPLELAARGGSVSGEPILAGAWIAEEDRAIIVSNSGIEKCRAWSQTGETLITFGGKASQADLSSDGKTAVVGFPDQRVVAYDVLEGKERGTWRSPQRIELVRLTRDGKAAVVGVQGINPVIWRLGEGVEDLPILEVKQARCMAEDPAGRWLAMSGIDSPVALVSRVGEPGRLIPANGQNVFSLVFSPDGRFLTGASYEGALLHWEVASGQLLWERPIPMGHVVESAQSSDGSLLALSDHLGQISVWQMPQGRLVMRHQAHQGRSRFLRFGEGAGREGGISEVLLSGADDGQFRVWNVSVPARRELATQLESEVLRIDISQDGRHVATTDMKGTIHVLDLRTGEVVGRSVIHSALVWSLGFSTDGQRLGSAGLDGTMVVWRFADGEPMVITRYAERGVSTLCLGSNQVLTVSRYSLDLWSLSEAGNVMGAPAASAVLSGAEVWSAEVSPDAGTLLLGLADGSVELWKLPDLKPLRRLDAHEHWVTGFEFFPSGDFVLTSSRDAAVKQWSFPSMKFEKEYSGHREWVNKVCVHPDGHLILSGSDDTTIRFWDTRRSAVLKLIRGDKEITSLFFEPDGRHWGYGDRRSIVIYPTDWRILESDPISMIQMAQNRSGMELVGFDLTLRK
jgi:serine/threonine protein kinase/WD40 repeat protein